MELDEPFVLSAPGTNYRYYIHFARRLLVRITNGTLVSLHNRQIFGRADGIDCREESEKKGQRHMSQVHLQKFPHPSAP